MLIKEVLNSTNTFPLIESELINDGDIINHEGGIYVWSEQFQTFRVEKPGPLGNGSLTPKKGDYLDQGSREEWEVLSAAGIIKKGGQMTPALKTRFKNMFGKGRGSKNFKSPNVNDKPKSKFGSGFLGGIGSDVKAGGDVGFGNKIGRAIGSAFGQMADDTVYPKNLEMHFVSKKGKPVDVILQQRYTGKDFKKLTKDKGTVQVKSKKQNTTYSISPAKLVVGYHEEQDKK